MTVLSKLIFGLNQTENLISKKVIPNDISIVIPVKDNQLGINKLLESFFKFTEQKYYPKEIIIVDNNSVPPVNILNQFRNKKTDVKPIVCKKLGPASARNHGARQAKGNWLLFLDSDCVFTESTISGYLEAKDGAIAYAGIIHSLGNGVLSKYYDDQEILVPLKIINNKGEHVPQYLITANCLIWKEAFNKLTGFNETIKIAGGEDIDLGLRLSEIGELQYAYNSIANHDFNDGIRGFIKRFIRYGMGNKLVENIYDSNLEPKPFKPNKINFQNYILARIQYLSLKIGYNRMKKITDDNKVQNAHSR